VAARRGWHRRWRVQSATGINPTATARAACRSGLPWTGAGRVAVGTDVVGAARVAPLIRRTGTGRLPRAFDFRATLQRIAHQRPADFHPAGVVLW